MKSVGIICEYNPFHNGHLYQVEKIRKYGGTHIIAAMSGNFVQRGDVACFSKWARAKACIENGIDLVLEMQTPIAMSPAKDFSFGAVSILNHLQIDALSFGSESADSKNLILAAKACQKAENSHLMKELLSQGKSYPQARQVALSQIMESEHSNLILNPNDVLGIEYINAINSINPNIDLMPIKRENVLHDSRDVFKNIASASFLRELICNEGIDAIKAFVPDSAFKIYKEEVEKKLAPCNLKNLEQAIIYKLKTSSLDTLSKISDMPNPLANRIFEMGQKANSVEELLALCSSKSYTNARIRRLILNTLLDIKKGEFEKEPEYIRVLAMNKKGMELLKRAKISEPQIPILPKFSNIAKMGFAQANLEAKATNVYSLSSPQKCISGLEFTQNAIIKY